MRKVGFMRNASNASLFAVFLFASLGGCVSLESAGDSIAFDEEAFALIRMKTHGMT